MHAAGRFHPPPELPIPNPRDAVGSNPHCRCWWWLSWCWVPPPLAPTGGGNTTEATGTGDTTPGRHSCPCCPPPHAKCPYFLRKYHHHDHLHTYEYYEPSYERVYEREYDPYEVIMMMVMMMIMTIMMMTRGRGDCPDRGQWPGRIRHRLQVRRSRPRHRPRPHRGRIRRQLRSARDNL